MTEQTAVLPPALAEGRLHALPHPLAAGAGSEAVPDALELQRRDGCAQQAVVTR